MKKDTGLTNMRISKKISLLALVFCLAALFIGSAMVAEEDETQKITADDAWDMLMEGNARFVANEPIEKNFTAERAELVGGQSPFVTVITCSDSRVPPELIFDQGLGDIFVIRVAGNVVDPVVLGSIEYGVEHLHTPLLVILGHQCCGAVTAAVQGGAEGNIGCIMEEIEPAVEVAEESGETGAELVEVAIDENVELVIENVLEESPITEELVEDGELVIIGAKYYLDSGEVEFLSQVDATTLESEEHE